MYSALMITTGLRCTVLWKSSGSQSSLEYYVVVVLLTFFSISHEQRGLTIRHRGYYMPARGYEFYLLVVNSISHSFAALTREISS